MDPPDRPRPARPRLLNMICHPQEMPSTPKPALVLDYEQPRQSSEWRWLLLPLGLAPFAMEVVAFWLEATTGDPPSSLGDFKAYHYWTGAAVLLGLAWLLWTGFAFRRRDRWIVLVAVAWWLWVCWVGFEFLRGLHRHPAGQYYWSIW